MGTDKIKLVRESQTRQQHIRHLLADMKALQLMLDRGMFESDVQRIGAEQELAFVDFNWRPAPVLMEVLDKLDDPHFTTEFARFNMEINLDPLEFKGDCLSRYHQQLQDYLGRAEKAANEFKAHVILCGIVPTIRYGDINAGNLTPLPRYEALVNLLHELRGGNFEFSIHGIDSLYTRDVPALFEGSNTSFQVHLQIPPDDFVRMYNWSLAITGPLMAACTNSPLVMGRRLWRESRIAVFQQSIDTRTYSELIRDRCPRVHFGTKWVDHSVLDLFKEDLARHRPMLTSTSEEDAVRVVESGEVPKLLALNIQNGTIYKWNRPCYGITHGKPHLRIEMRVLPAGPTIADEIANAAFWLGMMKGMPDRYAYIHRKMDFDFAKDNFHKAAQLGLGAQFLWAGAKKRIPSSELILKEFLPIAEDGLKKAGCNADDITKYLGIVHERVEAGSTGSQWQLDSFEKLKKMGTKDEALVGTTAGMFLRQQVGEPVHTWSLAEMHEAGNWVNRYWTIEQIMSTDLFTAREDDPVDYIANIMYWRNIRHLPVENDRGELSGLVTCKQLMSYYSQTAHHPVTALTRDVMISNLLTVTPEMLTIDAILLMQKNEVGCLPVVRDGKLIGLVTEYDFVSIASNLLQEWANRERQPHRPDETEG